MARGSRETHARVEANGGFRTKIDACYTAAPAEANSANLITASGLRSLTGSTAAAHAVLSRWSTTRIGLTEYSGNRQHITIGNLTENPRAFLFLRDYARLRRVKIWGCARVVDDDPVLVARLMPDGYDAQSEAAILLEITAWDTGCRQHIPHKFDADMVAAALATRDDELARLKADLAALQTAKGDE